MTSTTWRQQHLPLHHLPIIIGNNQLSSLTLLRQLPSTSLFLSRGGKLRVAPPQQHGQHGRRRHTSSRRRQRRPLTVRRGRQGEWGRHTSLRSIIFTPRHLKNVFPLLTSGTQHTFFCCFFGFFIYRWRGHEILCVVICFIKAAEIPLICLICCLKVPLNKKPVVSSTCHSNVYN
jgi:hypothetical protein